MLITMYVSNIDHHSDGNMNHKKQAQITFNLFHFSRHRVHYIQNDEKGGIGSIVVWLILSLNLYLLLQNCQTNI